MNKTYSKCIIYAIALFMHNSCLFGMKIFQAAKDPYHAYRNGDLNDVYSGFTQAMMQKENGDIVGAKTTLFDTYAYAQKNKLLGAIEPIYLKGVCKYVELPALAKHHGEMISKPQSNHNNKLYDAVNNRFLNDVQQYHTKNIQDATNSLFESYSYAQHHGILDSLNPLLIETVRKHLYATQFAQKDYQSALTFTDNVIEKIDLYSLLAKQAYAEGNFALGQEYYKPIFELKKKMPRHINPFAKYAELAKGCATTQASRYLALMYAQDALMAIDLNERLSQKSCLPLEEALNILKNETLLKNVREKALILDKYYEIIFALNTSAKGIMKNVCSHYTNATDAAIMGLFNASMGEKIKSNTIKNITFNEPDLIQFYNEEGSVAIPVMEKIILAKKLSPEVKDLFHIIIGGYYYHNKNAKFALCHFEQCSTYSDDLYLQALTIELDKEKVTSILPFLHKNLTACSSKKKKHIMAKEIITKVCGYNSSASTEKILSMSQELLPEFAILTNSRYELGYIQALLGLNDLHKKTDLLIEQRTLANQLTTYFEFFSLLHANDQKGLDAFFAQKNEALTGLQRTLLKSIRGNKKNDLQKIEFESDFFKALCDHPSLLKIIAKTIEHPQKRFKIRPAQCYYLLGGLAWLQKEYPLAHACFLRCDQNDLYVRAKIIETAPIQALLESLVPCIPLLNQAQENDRTNAAKAIITQVIVATHKEYRDLLIHNKQYEKAYEFAYYLAQLNQLIPSQLICNIFSKVETSIIGESRNTYRALLQSPHRLSIYNLIKKWADEKDPAACDCTSFILYEHSKCSHLNESDQTALTRGCLEYLGHSLERDNRTNGSQQIKRSLYSNLACIFGIREQSIDLLDKAIEYGNKRALYEKANLLTKEKPISPHNASIARKLLEQHILSNDSDTRRAQAYKALGEYYHTIKDITHQKKAFDYLKAAADLGNYDAGHLLGLFYIDGIENHQAPDIEKALMCFQKVIDLNENNDRYANTRYIRAATHYQQNEYTKAHEDLVHVLNYQGYDDSQKLFAHWLIGLTKLGLNENHDISKEITYYLNKAHEIAIKHKNENPDSLFIQQFMLCNDEKTLHLVQKNIDCVIENKKTDPASLDFCTTMGAIIFEQCIKASIENPVRQLAVKSLVYAAENKHKQAPCFLLMTTESEVDTWDKIYYFAALQHYAPDWAKESNSILKDLYPADVISQGILLKRLVERNDLPILEKYKSRIYEDRKPIVVDPISYNVFSAEMAQQAIEDSISLTSLIQLADAFIKNPAKSTPQEHFMALWRGSLLAYSLDQKLLLKAATYLETSRKYFPTIQQEHIEINLGYIYYKLGWMQYKSNNLTLAIGYLKKGDTLHNQNCAQLLKELSPTTLQTPQPQQYTDHVQEQLERFRVLVKNQKQHPDYEHLVCPLTDTLANDRIECTNALQTITKGKSAIHLAQSDNPKVSLGYAIAACDDLQNNESVKLSIQNGIKYGTIKNAATSHHAFKDLSILEQICTVTERIIQKNNSAQMNLLLGTIKREMLKHNIDLKAFERFYKAFYKINLAQNNVWKKIRSI